MDKFYFMNLEYFLHYYRYNWICLPFRSDSPLAILSVSTSRYQIVHFIIFICAEPSSKKNQEPSKLVSIYLFILCAQSLRGAHQVPQFLFFFFSHFPKCIRYEVMPVCGSVRECSGVFGSVRECAGGCERVRGSVSECAKVCRSKDCSFHYILTYMTLTSLTTDFF